MNTVYLEGDPGLPFLLRHARATYGNAIRHALVEAGYEDIPLNGPFVLGILARSPPAMPLGELIGSLGLSKQSSGQLVDQLVNRGYVVRQPDEHDRRRLTVSLTELGHAAAEVQRNTRDRIDAELTAIIGQPAFADLTSYLTRIIQIGVSDSD